MKTGKSRGNKSDIHVIREENQESDDSFKTEKISNLSDESESESSDDMRSIKQKYDINLQN